MSPSEQTRPDPRVWAGWETPPGVPGKAFLELLAADAAGRAAAMLAGSATTTEDSLVDAIRLLATAAGAPHVGAVARLTGVPEDDVRRLVLAYRHGGTGGVSAALAPTPCGSEEMAAAMDEVGKRRAFSDRALSVDLGEITDAGAGLRLRLGPDGRWYPFTLARRQWWPTIGANASVGAAYQAAARAKSLRGASI
jgi:hypothetical protein